VNVEDRVANADDGVVGVVLNRDTHIFCCSTLSTYISSSQWNISVFFTYMKLNALSIVHVTLLL
jgi:hypothetical protein